jgi:UDPglucose 6-dehydrogenase
MNSKKRIAIVGYGFVGQAVEYGFKNTTNDVLIVDPYKGYSNVDDLHNFSPEFIFISVPTQMGSDGNIDSRTIEAVMREITLTQETCENSVIVIKSTVTPDIINELSSLARVVYNPEFLTERNSLEEFVNPKFHVLGGRKEDLDLVKDLYLYNSNCNPAPFHYMTAVEASLVKYGVNSFLASKVIWFNQWKDMVESLGARYNIVSKAIGSDPRVGHSHTSVPGYDKKRGYGGSCLPKDTNAIFNFSKGTLSVLEEVINVNNEYRKVYELEDREKAQNVRYDKDGQ